MTELPECTAELPECIAHHDGSGDAASTAEWVLPCPKRAQLHSAELSALHMLLIAAVRQQLHVYYLASVMG